MKHKHHIIPVHAGGTNDPSNLVEVSIYQHAELHRARWESLGEYEDWLAWKALSGQIGREDIQTERSRLGGITRRGQPLGPKSMEHRAKISATLTGRKQSPATSEKKRKIMVGNQYRLGKYHTEETKNKMRASRAAYLSRKAAV